MTHITEDPNVCSDLVPRPPFHAAIVTSLPVAVEDLHLCANRHKIGVPVMRVYAEECRGRDYPIIEIFPTIQRLK